jgi:protein-disulfide isomerase
MILKTACVLCMGTYACVTAIFITAGLSASGELTSLPGRLFADLRSAFAKPQVLTVAVLFVLGATSVVAWFPKEARVPAAPPQAVSQDVETAFADTWSKQPRVDLGVQANGAKVVVVKFNDWMCPACKGYQQAYQPIFDRYEQSDPGAVKLVAKDWPWNTNCNSNVTQTFIGHEESCNAAVAVRLARDHGKGEDMIAWLFGNQERLGEIGRTRPADAEKEIRAKASELSGVADFAHEYLARMSGIASDVATGKILNVNSTPTYFINGVRVTGGDGGQIPPQYFDLAIKLELKRTTAR